MNYSNKNDHRHIDEFLKNIDEYSIKSTSIGYLPYESKYLLDNE